MKFSNISDIELNIKTSYGVVICGAGTYGRKCYDLLQKRRLERKILCFGVDNRMDNPPECCGLPVFMIDSLKHLSSSAIFLVAVGKKFRDEFNNAIKKINVDDSNIFEIDDCFFETNEMYDRSNDGMNGNVIFEKYVNRFDQVCRLIEMQDEISFVNKEAFDGMKSCFKDREVVVVGTGPTLSKYKPIENAIHIGVNGAWKHRDIQLDYYFIQDGDRRCLDSTSEGLRVGLKGVKKIFIGKFLPSNNNWYYRFPENYFEIDERVTPFYSGGLREDLYRGNVIHTDIRFHPLMEFGSVIFPAIHFALYTHPRKIYFVGCDTTLIGKAGGHFYETNLLDDDGKINYDLGVQLGYAAVHDFASFNYPDTELISINPVGLKGLFNDEYTE